ncbi:MAG: EAL domain-containing protein [Coprobacillus cateniformis]
MKVVAEGIENEEQLALLDGTGCDMIQGYIYAKPLDVKEFYVRLDEKR